MPTFRDWKTKSGHGVVANLPDAPHPFTYQLKPRAVKFYKELGYENRDSIDGRLVWPLRKLGDLYILDEEESSDGETNELPALGDLDKFSFTSSEKRALAQYVRNHPRFTEDIGSDLNQELFGDDFNFSEIEKEGPNTTSNMYNRSSQEELVLPSYITGYLGDLTVKTTYTSVEYRGDNVEDYVDTILQIPNVTDSIREFTDHEYNMGSISIADTYLSYVLEVDGRPESILEVSDRRFDQSEFDFEIEFWVVGSRMEQCCTDMTHSTKLTDGYISDWEIRTDQGKKIRRENLTPADHHNMVYEQSKVFEEIISFFDCFGGYEIADPD